MSPAAEKPKRRRGVSSHTRMHRDWMAMLLPIFITVGISVVANVGVGIWQGATFRAQVQHIDQHQTEQDKAIDENSKALQALYTRLPIDYVPRVEHEKDAVLQKELREMEANKIAAMDAKLDTLLERGAVLRR